MDSVEGVDSPAVTNTPKTTGRLQEARNWVTKAKIALKDSRNLRNDLKATLSQAVDDLYQLVKGAMLEKGPKTHDAANLQAKEPRKNETTTTKPANEDYSQLLYSLADHSKLMRDSSCKIQELKEALEIKLEVITYAAVEARDQPSSAQPVLPSANLQRKELATAELLGVAEERKVAIALIQEPYVGSIRRMRDYRGVRIFQALDDGSGTVKAAIAVFEQDLDVIQSQRKGGKTSTGIYDDHEKDEKEEVQEAAALVIRAKLALSQSKNLKTEVKKTLVNVLNKFEKLVADSEAEYEAEKARKGSRGSGDGVPVNISTGTAAAVPPYAAEHKEGMKALQGELARFSQEIREQRRSYASVTASRPQQPSGPAALHSVVVTSEDDQETADEVLGKANLQRKKLAYSDLPIEASNLRAWVALIKELYVDGIGRIGGRSGIRVF
ncbi:unnamed protein product [Arctia plantaginis]|uniref:Uncharacterized protein n=1 Tax=Arctia plantaginis TaxID=874455 RepID=A0A8S1BB56_ARCPL|nr:unnamed protein product [Arctia plantaginis]